jgi:hypothetical protein
MTAKCKVGDLAIVVRADYACNLGKIVRIAGLHDGSGDLVFTNRGTVWWVTCPSRMKWSLDGKVFRRVAGPAPDDQLLPIRGNEQKAKEEAARLIRKISSKGVTA